MSLSLYHDHYKALQPSKGHLVMLHGWGMNSLVWDELIPLLNEYYDITLIDLPGMGRSPLPSGDYTIERVCEKILEVAPAKASWIAWSLGATCVQHIASTQQEIIEHAFLLAATPKFVASDDWSFAMPAKVFEQFQALLEEDWEGTLIRFLTLQCKGSESIREDTKKLRERLFHHGLPAQKALREGLNILKQSDLRNELKKTSVDMHFILGQFDTLIPNQVAEQLIQLNPTVQLSIIEGASHVPQLSHPQKVAQVIDTVMIARNNKRVSA